MRIEEDMKLDYKDVLIRPKRSTLGSRKEVNLERGYKFRNYKTETPFLPVDEDYHYRGVPIMASNMDGVGTFKMADNLALQGIMTCLVKTYSVNELVGYFDQDDKSHDPARTEYVAMSIGITDKDHQKFRDVYEQVGNQLKFVCIDVANGYSERFANFVKEFRTHYPDIVIIAGNVVTGEMTEELLLSGADIIKVGIGPGSVCTTRIQTGVGYPQLSAVIECADAAHGLGGHIIADGGCTCPGDVAKAFAGGADFVMLGGMLAGHNEGGGEIITKYYKTGEWVRNEQSLDGQTQSITWEDGIERKKFVQFYGMSSKSANDKHFNGLKDYRSSEGREVLVPYRGSVKDTVQDLLGGLRSTCTYAGAIGLKQLSKCTTFVRCTQTHNQIYESTTIGK
jgi:GMP reductase|tara:strand:- start:12183 stop:13367 length:1185 start_codon:yes stop_codon:yes gene_type:complete